MAMPAPSSASPGPVRTRPLGTTGLRVSPLGVGTAALGRPGYINLGHGRDLPSDRTPEALEAHAHDVLDAAYAAGVRYVDAARSYGHAEDFVASWAASRGHQDVTIGSKWGYTYTAGWRVDAEEHEVKDHSLANLRRQVAQSRAALGSRLRIYQIHSATLDSGVLEDRSVLAELADLAEEGLVIGLSLSGPGQAATLRRALEQAADGVASFRCVQATWNLLEPSVGPALAQAHDTGWGVIIKEAVANGRLAPGGDGAHSLAALAQERGVGVDAIAIAAALAQPFSDVVLSAAATVAHLRSNAAALQVVLDDGALAAVKGLAVTPQDYWTHRAQLPWT